MRPFHAPRELFIISDLHLGGVYPKKDGERVSSLGFRMMTNTSCLANFIEGLSRRSEATELVINGDFLDFLAEPGQTTPWSSFHNDEEYAGELLHQEMQRDDIVFDALHDFCRAGNRLTILLGNHDVELALPHVRRLLEERVSPNQSIRFFYDGEAYRVGPVLIEHGNRYDGFNIIDHNGLRVVRSSLSRGQAPPLAFESPPGSRLVAEIMNPLKEKYPFVDLLKPEGAALFALIAALEPDVRHDIRRLAVLATEAVVRNRLDSDHRPHRVELVSRRRMTQRDHLPSPLSDVLNGLEELGFSHSGNDVMPVGARSRAVSAAGLVGLVLLRDWVSLQQRLPLIRMALRSLEGADSLDAAAAPSRTFEMAAAALVSDRTNAVVFGHTHHACDVPVAGGRYLNSGTWANLMRFPSVFHGQPPTPDERARELADPSFHEGEREQWWLERFVRDCTNSTLEPYLMFRPTVVKVGGGEYPQLLQVDPKSGGIEDHVQG